MALIPALTFAEAQSLIATIGYIQESSQAVADWLETGFANGDDPPDDALNMAKAVAHLRWHTGISGTYAQEAISVVARITSIVQADSKPVLISHVDGAEFDSANQTFIFENDANLCMECVLAYSPILESMDSIDSDSIIASSGLMRSDAAFYFTANSIGTDGQDVHLRMKYRNYAGDVGYEYYQFSAVTIAALAGDLFEDGSWPRYDGADGSDTYNAGVVVFDGGLADGWEHYLNTTETQVSVTIANAYLWRFYVVYTMSGGDTRTVCYYSNGVGGYTSSEEVPDRVLDIDVSGETPTRITIDIAEDALAMKGEVATGIEKIKFRGTGDISGIVMGDSTTVTPSPVSSGNAVPLAIPSVSLGNWDDNDWESLFGVPLIFSGDGNANIETGTFEGKYAIRCKLDPTSNGSTRITADGRLPNEDHYLLKFSVLFEGADFEWGDTQERIKFGFGLGGDQYPGADSGSPVGGGNNEPDACRFRFMIDGDRNAASTAESITYGYFATQPDNDYSGVYDFAHGSDGVSNKISKNVWIPFEMEVKVNSSINAADGFFKARRNGVEVQNEQNVQMFSLGSPQLNRLIFECFFGGNNSDYSPSQTEYILFADIEYEVIT